MPQYIHRRCKVCKSNAKQGFEYCKKHIPSGVTYNPKLADPSYRRKRYKKDLQKLQRNQYKGWKPSKGTKIKAVKNLGKARNSFDENRCTKIIEATGERCKNHMMNGSYFCRQHQPK